MKKISHWVILIIALSVASVVGKEIGKTILQDVSQNTVSNPFPKTSPLHIPYQRFSKKLNDLPEFKQQIRNAKNTNDAMQLGYLLVVSGLKRLDNDSLEKRMRISAKMLDIADIETCAMMYRGGSPQSKQNQNQVYAVIGLLDSETINEYFDLSFNAINAELKQYPKPVLHEQEILKATDSLLKHLTEQDSKRLKIILGDLNNQSSQNVCWAGRTVYSVALRMDTNNKQILARLLVSD